MDTNGHTRICVHVAYFNPCSKLELEQRYTLHTKSKQPPLDPESTMETLSVSTHVTGN